MEETPTITKPLLVKLGSLAVHIDEYLNEKTDNGKHVDVIAIDSLLGDPEVKGFLKYMDANSFLPVRRDGVRYR